MTTKTVSRLLMLSHASRRTRASLLCLFCCWLSLPAVLVAQDARQDLQSGRAKLDSKDYRRAIVDFTIAIEKEPSVEAFLLRAEAKHKIEDLKGALNDYEEALLLDANNPILLNNKGNLLDEQGKFNEAISAYTQAITLDSAYTNAYYNRGIARYNFKDYAGALSDFEKVLSHTPEDGEAMLGLALAAQKLGNTMLVCQYLVKSRQRGITEADTYLEKFCK